MSPAVPTHSNGRGALMPIGGAEDKLKERRILSRFLELAGCQQATIAVIPAASGRANEVGDRYQALFLDLGAPQVEVVHIHSRVEAQDSGRVAVLERASAIFLTGGDQLRLATLLGGTAIAQAIRRHSADGKLVAGTSAGASILCQHMIAFGRSGEAPSQRMVQLAPGLGLTNRAIIDQHFQQRGRTGRLMVAVAHNPFLIGLGIDEDTAAIIDSNNVMEVVGRGSVIVVDGAGMTYTNVHEVKRHEPVAVADMRLHVLSAGFRYDLIQRKPIVMRET